ncbi:adenylyl-sulfate kinase [Flavobacteriaceae bacterium Ap0902]|nr:adenylyl-sulfate kinase [Flavobacteriaceae bacterium Ap0902]
MSDNSSENIINQDFKITRTDREATYGHRAKVFWLTGYSGSGKSTLGNRLEEVLFHQGIKTYVLDGDNLRLGLNQGLGFSPEDRQENLRRVAEVSKLFIDAGLVVLAAFISPLEKDREMVQSIIGKDDFITIFVDCPIEVCEQRDVKGLYAKARRGEIHQFTGISAPYEKPKKADLILKTAEMSKNQCVQDLLALVLQKIKLEK